MFHGRGAEQENNRYRTMFVPLVRIKSRFRTIASLKFSDDCKLVQFGLGPPRCSSPGRIRKRAKARCKICDR